MNIITIDDEELALSALNRAVKAAVPDATLKGFMDSDELIYTIRNEGFFPDVVFMDIELSNGNGLNLAQIIQSVCPEVNIIFVTGFAEYALDAYAVHPSGYLTKPVTRDEVIKEIQNLRYQPTENTGEKPVYIRCFGDFEVLYKGNNVRFTRTKSMEILAFLVSRRGNSCTRAQIANVLWEDGRYDRSRQNQLSTICHELIKTLEAYGISDIVRISHNSYAVAIERFDCDYYKLLQGDNTAINQFTGEFMSQYSWAEESTAILAEKYM